MYCLVKIKDLVGSCTTLTEPCRILFLMHIMANKLGIPTLLDLFPKTSVEWQDFSFFVVLKWVEHYWSYTSDTLFIINRYNRVKHLNRLIIKPVSLKCYQHAIFGAMWKHLWKMINVGNLNLYCWNKQQCLKWGNEVKTDGWYETSGKHTLTSIRLCVQCRHITLIINVNSRLCFCPRIWAVLLFQRGRNVWYKSPPLNSPLAKPKLSASDSEHLSFRRSLWLLLLPWDPKPFFARTWELVWAGTFAGTCWHWFFFSCGSCKVPVPLSRACKHFLGNKPNQPTVILYQSLAAGEKLKTGDAASARSMAQNNEESPLRVSKNQTGNGAGRMRRADNSDPNTYGFGHMIPLACGMEKHCCQTAAAPQEELLNADCRVGDSRSFSACATISETARELCKAVSVSLGLAMECSDSIDMDAALPQCAANDHIRGEYLFGVGGAPLSCPGGQAAVSDYKCPEERLLHGHKQQQQLMEMFKSSETAAHLQHLTSARTPVDEQNFTMCKAEDITPEETAHLDSVRAASCPYAQSAQPGNLTHFGPPAQERPWRLYKPPDEAGDFGEVMESSFATTSGYQSEQYSVKIKCEGTESAGALWGGNHSFNDRYNSQCWGPRQCVSAHGAGGNSALCNPYERSMARPEQWYPGGMLRSPYPNSSYVKSEVSEWLDVPYNDPR